MIVCLIEVLGVHFLLCFVYFLERGGGWEPMPVIPGEGTGSRLSFFAAVESQVNMYFFSPDSGQKPFPCQKCGAFFSTKSNCERHQLRKHGVTACSLRRNGLIPQSKESDGARDSTGSASRRWRGAPLAARPPFLCRSPRVPAAGEGLTFPSPPPHACSCPLPPRAGRCGRMSSPALCRNTSERDVEALGWCFGKPQRGRVLQGRDGPAGKVLQEPAMPRPPRGGAGQAECFLFNNSLPSKNLRLV